MGLRNNSACNYMNQHHFVLYTLHWYHTVTDNMVSPRRELYIQLQINVVWILNKFPFLWWTKFITSTYRFVCCSQHMDRRYDRPGSSRQVDDSEPSTWHWNHTTRCRDRDISPQCRLCSMDSPRGLCTRVDSLVEHLAYQVGKSKLLDRCALGILNLDHMGWASKACWISQDPWLFSKTK
jgi:hypothetical protein